MCLRLFPNGNPQSNDQPRNSNSKILINSTTMISPSNMVVRNPCNDNNRAMATVVGITRSQPCMNKHSRGSMGMRAASLSATLVEGLLMSRLSFAIAKSAKKSS